LNFRNIDWIPRGKSAWAPGVTEKNGTYYVYYSVGPKPSHIGVASASSPAGPFTDSGKPLLSDDNDPSFEAIDAMAFTDPNSGVSYLYAGGSAGSRLRVFELNDDMLSFKREIKADNPSHFTEGAFMHYYNGLYYLSYSHGGWNSDTYSVHYSTAPGPSAPGRTAACWPKATTATKARDIIRSSTMPQRTNGTSFTIAGTISPARGLTGARVPSPSRKYTMNPMDASSRLS
jgi:hypothetical protein